MRQLSVLELRCPSGPREPESGSRFILWYAFETLAELREWYRYSDTEWGWIIREMIDVPPRATGGDPCQ